MNVPPLTWPQRSRREGTYRRAWRCTNAGRRYKVVESKPPGLSRVFYAELFDGDRWIPVQRTTTGTIRRHRTQRAAMTACNRHHRENALCPSH